jgi:hypothetical protein
MANPAAEFSNPAGAPRRCPFCRGPLWANGGCLRCPPRPATWPGRDAEGLLTWFAAFPWPRRPFAFAPWRRVTDPERFCRTLAEDIERGPGGPHIHNRHVMADVRALRRLFGDAGGGS